MPQRTVIIPGVGEVLLAKRRGARNLRLSITAKGQVRVSMPSWTPYAAGAAFARGRADWINKHLGEYPETLFEEGMLIGKAHRLHFNTLSDHPSITTRVTPSKIEITMSQPFNDQAVQAKVRLACERALRSEAEHLLPQRLSILASKNGFSYKQLKIRKLTSRWGSCSQDKTISLSYYLMQLPWPLIDYVILHELVHTKHLHHGSGFWTAFEKLLPGARKLRKEIHKHKPLLTPTQSAASVA